jgi:Tfp pilus assembly protein PilX
MVAVLTSTQSESTVNEWFSAQALYAAESGVQASAWLINQNAGVCTAANTAVAVQLEAGRPAWYTISSVVVSISGINLCRITAIGMAGGTSTNPIAQRLITVDYKSIVVP